MNETIIQALLQGLKVFLVAGLTALGASLADIVQIGTEGDVLTGPLIISIGSAVIVAILKAIGGPTEPMPESAVRGVAAGGPKPKRPSFLSV